MLHHKSHHPLLPEWKTVCLWLPLTLFLLAAVQSQAAQYPHRTGTGYSTYTLRSSRADQDSFDSFPRYQSSPFYSNSNGQRFATNSVTSVVAKPSARSYVMPSSPVVIRHPSSCSYDRSHAACTFTLLCYLANGVPVEGCEENPSLTCCYINGKHVPAQQTKPEVSSSVSAYRQYSSPSPEPVSKVTSVSFRSPSSYHSPSNAITSFYSPNSNYRSTQYSNSEVPPSSRLTVESSFGLNEYRHKQDLLAPFETNKPTASKSMEVDYTSNTIRRTRTENIKSIFQEIANRKLYARNYDVEDICGKPMAKPRSRIIGGQDAYFGEFPWQVHIKITKHQCGGALINSQFIVTAAHCIYQAPMRQLNVIIGAHDIEDPRFQDVPPQYFSVSKVILHPNFRFSASHPDRYDIALIKLDKPVRFGDSVLPVCLPEENFQFEGWKGVVTGWGKTDPALSNRYGTRLLQKVDVPVIDNDKCETWHRTRGIDLHIFTEMMCAGYEDGQKDACVGDSGGPLVINVNGRWTLAGITSAGFGCAQSKQPGIYHRVSHTVEWIKSTVQSEKEIVS